MLSSPLLSLLIDVCRSGNSGPKIKGKIGASSVGLEEEALSRTAEGTIARVSTAEGTVVRGIPVV